MSRLSIIALVAVAACAPTYKGGPHDTFFQRAPEPKPHAIPASISQDNDWWDEALHSIIMPLTRIASPAVYASFAFGGPRALDINEFGQVPDSTWFENRITRGLATTKDIAAGPAASRGPAPGILTIINGKLQGVAPGFVVRDSAGVVFFVKFDPPAFPALATGAEIIATRILHAAGYHVPDNYIVELELERLVLDPGAKTRDDYNRKVRLTQEDLDFLLLQLNPTPKGTLRAIFSRSVPGTPIGPFRYRGVREGDPNDTIEHQRRRSLRGLRMFSAWLGNVDVRDQNSIDTFIETPEGSGKGYLKHYLLDFGAALGSNSVTEKHTAQGYERFLEWKEIGLRWITFGFRDPLWFKVKRSPHREVGIFEAEVFDPATWAPTFNNPAFNAADIDDMFWAASIIAHFSLDDIKAAVSAAEYREEAAADWVARTLFARRNKILRFAFSKRSALDIPRVKGDMLRLTDLVVLAELAQPLATYEFSVRWERTRGGDRGIGTFTRATPELDLKPIVEDARKRFGSAFKDDPFLVVTARRVLIDDRGPSVDIVLRVTDDMTFPVALRR